MSLARFGNNPLWKAICKQYQKSVAACVRRRPLSFGRPFFFLTRARRAGRGRRAAARASRPRRRRSRRNRRRRRSLNEAGLKYDDVKIEQDEDYQKALGRLSQDELQQRARRMKRAFDISFKRKVLPPDLQAANAPLEGYASTLAEDARARRIERELLNTYN